MKNSRRAIDVVVSVLLLLPFLGLTWINTITVAEDWRSYRRARPEKVLIEAVQIAKRRVSLEVTTEIYIDLTLQVRGNAEMLWLTATFIGETPEHAADIAYLASNKGHEVELWIDPRNNGRFSLRHEFPRYRAELLAVSATMTLVFTWILFMVLKSLVRSSMDDACQ